MHIIIVWVYRICKSVDISDRSQGICYNYYASRRSRTRDTVIWQAVWFKIESTKRTVIMPINVPPIKITNRPGLEARLCSK